MKSDTATATVTDSAPVTLTLYRGDRAAPVAALDEQWWRDFAAACARAAPPSYRRGDAERIVKNAGLADRWWGRAIIDAERAGGFTPYQQSKSTGWRTCAVGRALSPVKMYKTPGPATWREPEDPQLRAAGDAFSIAVDRDDYVNAAFQLGLIECRAAALAAGGDA